MRSFLKGAIPADLYVWLCLCLLMVASPLWAQIDTGTILGTVTDQTGAVVPGAKVSLTNEGTNLTMTTTTGADGSYVFSPLKIGTYTVTVEAPGFSKAEQAHLTLSINQSLKADMQEFSWALSVQQRSGRLTAAMAGNCCGEIGQNVQALQVAGFGNSQQASRGELALGAAVAEADLTPLYPRAEGPFHAVVGRLHPFFF